jgi:(2S)-methylsuccinyl-CoA dehydrogenase
MHSYEMFYDDFFVPNANLVGGTNGEGKGFYFTMRGFMGGRLQTAARACGLMQAAMEASSAYASQRRVFGQAVADFPLTLAKIARMAAQLSACRHFTFAVARLMDQDQGQMEASLVKLLACRVAESVSREALQIHGGMGYAEETSVSRYFVDARVLSIFEGAEETLAIRVIGKALLDRRRG